MNLLIDFFTFFNQLDSIKSKNLILKELFGTFHDNCIEAPFNCDYGSNIHLDENVYMNSSCCLLDVCRIDIGANTLLGPGVQIYTASHSLDPIERRFTEFGKPVKIGKDCWIGGCAIICPGILV